MVKISVIVPVFNVESYIGRAFNSLLNQSIGFENLEIIFVDDVSTDSSPDIIRDYSNKYENVKSIFLEENSGSGGKPRNIGMSYATADYLMFLDSDDIFMEDACEILYNEITSENIDLVSGVHSWDGVNPSEGLWLSILTDPNENYQIRQDKVNDLLSNEFPFKINSIDDWESIIGDFAFQPKIYKRSFIEENHINFAEGIIAEDSVFVCNVLLNANGIKYIDKIVYLYYHDRSCDDPSMSQINSIKILKGLIDAFYMMYELSLNKNKSEIFIHYLLFQKLEYFIRRLLNSDLSIKDVLEVLSYSAHLFKLYVDYNNEINSNFSDLFKFIAYEDYENALVFMFGEDINENDDFPKISVIFPVFNGEYYLKEALDSLVNQTFIDNIEVIMVDNGSTDNSGVILEDYSKKYDNFYTYHKVHGEAGSSRNYGLKYACGEYIHFMDADDFLMYDAHEKLYNFAIKNNCEVVSSNYLRFNSQNVWSSELGRYVFKEYMDDIENTNLYEYAELSWDMPLWNKIIKRDFLEKNNIMFNEEIMYEDNLFMIEVYAKAINVGILNVFSNCWRVREVGTSLTQNQDFYYGLKFFNMAFLVNNFITENIHNNDVLNKKYTKFLTHDIFYFLFHIKNNYSKKYQGYLLESVLDMLCLVPRKYFENLTTYFQALHESILNRDFDNSLLFVSKNYRGDPKLPENLSQYYVDKIDFKKDARLEWLISRANNVFLDGGLIKIDFINRVLDIQNFDRTLFTLVNPESGNKNVLFIEENQLHIPLDYIEFGKSRIETTCYLGDIKKNANLKTHLNKTFNFDGYDLIIKNDVLGNLNLVKHVKNNAEITIEDVIFQSDKFQFKCKCIDEIDNIHIRDYFDLVKFKCSLEHMENNECLFEIEYCDLLKAPVKKWEIYGAKLTLTRGYEFSNDYYSMSIKNQENKIFIEFKLI